jgi:short subunit dehydrogenase
LKFLFTKNNLFLDNKYLSCIIVGKYSGRSKNTQLWDGRRERDIMELKNQKVIVVGGSSGLGLGIAKGVVAKGVCVIIASPSVEKLKKAAKEIGKKEYRVLKITKRGEGGKI